ncbi:Protein CBG26643 [Caenorhabditis briggsae]|uniref:Protein CBG26643 n=1 Tax=Caenorhabditis briggsae TaxID=6238 RepID=B6IE07_CAEBR|nr:Protein CBG26643 [Caenorhabditis briggsae]CAS01071.1 Protein CBG26643 [Caenorhabditis briggsae]
MRKFLLKTAEERKLTTTKMQRHLKQQLGGQGGRRRDWQKRKTWRRRKAMSPDEPDFDSLVLNGTMFERRWEGIYQRRQWRR